MHLCQSVDLLTVKKTIKDSLRDQHPRVSLAKKDDQLACVIKALFVGRLHWIYTSHCQIKWD